ncbi:MAG: ABC transporter substrate-binding protein, partial [Bacillota bacterium]
NYYLFYVYVIIFLTFCQTLYYIRGQYEVKMKSNIHKMASIIVAIILFVVSFFLIKEFTLNSTNNHFIGKDVKIGLIAPLTGSSRSGGESMKKGVELAVNNINENGGIGGHKLTLIIRDDKGISSQAVKVAKDLIFLDNVEAIIGPFNSDSCLAIMGLVNNLEVPLITPIAMADNINLANDYVFRNTLGASASQMKINSFTKSSQDEYILLEGFGSKTIGILWQGDKWGEEMQEIVLSDLIDLGREDALLFSEPFEIGGSDFSSFFKNHKDNYPDLMYIVSSGSESIDIVKAGREQDYKGLFYGEGGFNYETFDEELLEYADGCIFSTQWHPSFSTPMSDVFLEAYMQTYNDVPNMFTAISYEAVYILKDSLVPIIHNLSRDDFRQILQKELATPRTINGITGPLSFDQNGQCDRPMFILQKRWTGRNVQSVIVYPEKYSQGQIDWNFEL